MSDRRGVRRRYGRGPLGLFEFLAQFSAQRSCLLASGESSLSMTALRSAATVSALTGGGQDYPQAVIGFGIIGFERQSLAVFGCSGIKPSFFGQRPSQSIVNLGVVGLHRPANHG